MAVYLGYYRTLPNFAMNDTFRRLVVELPDRLPAGCLLIGSYAPTPDAAGEPGPPAVMIVETDNAADLQFIGRYYDGYLRFEWVGVTPVGATRAEREEWAATVTAPAETNAPPG